MAKFCPECGTPTIKIQDGEKMLDACPDAHFITIDETAAGVGALVFRNDEVLLVERQYPAGLWSLPRGWIQHGETLSQAIEREVLEETAIVIQAKGILSVSIRSTQSRNELYIVFLCQYVSGDPVPDMKEVSQVRFVHPDKMDDLDLSEFDRGLIANYIVHTPDVLGEMDALASIPAVTTYAFKGS